jgi:hypothetical protein
VAADKKLLWRRNCIGGTVLVGIRLVYVNVFFPPGFINVKLFESVDILAFGNQK